ncbi:hypothetical protein POTOM_023073 [Populus tomentosa]|uniref:Uncharacterized protein n=1 Tax=Populus tomentosa TaxID=118781 RepID=A0A8X7ZLM1_POPTO|nr:hypothetical protein POTOM_023073 [Populus tomentosa]
MDDSRSWRLCKRFPYLRFRRERDEAGPCEQLNALFYSIKCRPLQLLAKLARNKSPVISMANVSDLPPVTLAPDNDELLVSGDRNFAVHGEIMMLVLLLLFTLFFLFILYLVCAKRLKDASRVPQSELISPRNFTFSNFKGQIRSEGHLMHQSMESKTTQQPA